MHLVSQKLVDITDLKEPKKLLEKREKIATRKSKCILEMHAAKKELDKVNINIPEKCS